MFKIFSTWFVDYLTYYTTFFYFFKKQNNIYNCHNDQHIGRDEMGCVCNLLGGNAVTSTGISEENHAIIYTLHFVKHFYRV